MTAGNVSPYGSASGTDSGVGKDPGAALLPGLPRDHDGPVFAEPWQAQAFAMAVRLHDQGYFTWSEWAAALADRIAAAGPRDTADYYEHWLGALETLATGRLISTAELDDRRRAWRVAAARTPHGQPIEL